VHAADLAPVVQRYTFVYLVLKREAKRVAVEEV